MNRVVVMFALVFTASMAHGQQVQVPTEGQCKVDKAVWSGDVISTSALKSLDEGPLPARELLRRALEMGQCSVAYGKPGQDLYASIANAYKSSYDNRIASFLERHRDFWQLFIDEDAAGHR